MKTRPLIGWHSESNQSEAWFQKHFWSPIHFIQLLMSWPMIYYGINLKSNLIIIRIFKLIIFRFIPFFMLMAQSHQHRQAKIVSILYCISQKKLPHPSLGCYTRCSYYLKSDKFVGRKIFGGSHLGITWQLSIFQTYSPICHSRCSSSCGGPVAVRDKTNREWGRAICNILGYNH